APLDAGKSYFIKHTTQTSRVNVDRVHSKKDLDTLSDVAAETLALNEIGRATLTAHRALFIDGYVANRETGSFILIDSITNATVAAGMVIADGTGQNLDLALEDARRGESGGSRSQVSPKERRQRFGVGGGIVLLVTPAGGGAGRSAPLAYAVERALFDRGGSAALLSAEGGARWLAAGRAAGEGGRRRRTLARHRGGGLRGSVRRGGGQDGRRRDRRARLARRFVRPERHRREAREDLPQHVHLEAVSEDGSL